MEGTDSLFNPEAALERATAPANPRVFRFIGQAIGVTP